VTGLELGFDIGGTFTDIVLLDANAGHYAFYKLPSTPNDLSDSVIDGITELLRSAGAHIAGISMLRHGTTVATNAILERSYAKTALLTTRGFRDVLELGRQGRPAQYNLDVAKPDPIVPRRRRYEVRERMTASGGVIVELDQTDLKAALDALRTDGTQSVAVCLLHSYANPTHEAQIADAIRNQLPEIFVCTSSEVVNEFREYERFCSTVLNASLLPVMSAYIERLEARTKSMGIGASLQIMQSNGGIMSPGSATKRPINTFLSGPAAGVIGAVGVAREEGVDNFITFDMGGTSTDVCLVEHGVPTVRRQLVLAGLPVKTSTINIHVVGAGGGSIAWIDEGGLLKVGPRSAGSRPGPASYGNGGLEPTLTDANLCLGRLGPNSVLGGRIHLDTDAAAQAIATKIGAALQMDLQRAAMGILRIATSNVVEAIRAVSVQRGYDPRDFSLMAFGGAGPMHAAEIARELDISRVIIPTNPGLMCATGLLHADLRAEFNRTRIMRFAPSSAREFESVLNDLSKELSAWRRTEALDDALLFSAIVLDMRYAGQDFELEIRYDRADSGTSISEDIERVRRQFHDAHRAQYGYASPDRPIELVTTRLEATTPRAAVTPTRHNTLPGSPRIGYREAWLGESGRTLCPVYQRERLPTGFIVSGPAIIEQMDSTTVLLAGMSGRVGTSGALIVQVNA
jgi:N-methylhydantoinase A